MSERRRCERVIWGWWPCFFLGRRRVGLVFSLDNDWFDGVLVRFWPRGTRGALRFGAG